MSVINFPGVGSGGSGGPTNNSPSGMRRNSGNSRGAVNTNIVVYSGSAYVDGADVTHNDADCANNGSIFTIATTGTYSITVNYEAGGSQAVYILKNTSVSNNLDETHQILSLSVANTDWSYPMTVITKLTAGDKVWVHSTGAPGTGLSDDYAIFEIQRLS